MESVGLNGTKTCFLAIFLRFPPFTMPELNGTSFTGMNLEILETTARKFDLCYKVKVNPAVGYGIPTKNGSFNGALGVVQRNEADVFITPSTITYTRYQAVDYSENILTDYHGILYSYPTAETDVAGFIKPFSLQSWLVIFLCTVLMLFIFAALFKCITFIKLRNYEREGLENKEWYKAFYWTFPSLIGQPTPFDIKLPTVKVIVMAWILGAFIISNIYKSNLVAMLTTPKVNVPFDSLQEMVNVKDLRISITVNSVIQQAMMNAENGSILSLANKITDPLDFGDPKFVNPYFAPSTAGVKPFIGVNSALLGTMHFGFSQYGYCTVTKANEEFFPVLLAPAFPKESKIKDKFDYTIRAMKEGGILNYNFELSIANASNCKVRKGVNDSIRILLLEDFYGAFAILLGGCVLSFICFILEVIMGRNRMK